MRDDPFGLDDVDDAEPVVAGRHDRGRRRSEFVDSHHRDRGSGGSEEAPTLHPTPYQFRDPATIPVRPWVYGRHLCRGFLSLDIAPGGVGKSSLKLVEAVALAAGRNLLGQSVPEPLRVWVWNGEDPADELHRRIGAILSHYRVEPADLGGRLFLDSGRDSEIIIARTLRGGTVLMEPNIAALTAAIREARADVVILDPFVSIHAAEENNNGAIDMVAKALNRVAEECACAISLVHHVRKGNGQGSTTVEDGRGAGALLAAVRSARTLNPMTKEEAETAGVESPRSYFRVDNGKANLAPAGDRAEWFRLVGISLQNGPPGPVDLSDHVAVVEPWQWPEAMQTVTVAHLREAQRVIGHSGQWRQSPQSPQWAGVAIGQVMGLDPGAPKDRAVIKAALKSWLASGMLKVKIVQDDQRRERPCIVVGAPATD